MIHDLSARLSKSESGASGCGFYSSHPFPSRKDRTLDGFAKDALTFLTATPDGEPMSRMDTVATTSASSASARPTGWWTRRT